VLLPGLAQFDQTVIDRFEAAGVKLLRNRVTTLRLWLQLWNVQPGHGRWESAGEVTVATELLSPKQTVPLEEIFEKLLLHMIQDGLPRQGPKPRFFLKIERTKSIMNITSIEGMLMKSNRPAVVVTRLVYHLDRPRDLIDVHDRSRPVVRC
jgi:hypothetical protein